MNENDYEYQREKARIEAIEDTYTQEAYDKSIREEEREACALLVESMLADCRCGNISPVEAAKKVRERGAK